VLTSLGPPLTSNAACCVAVSSQTAIPEAFTATVTFTAYEPDVNANFTVPLGIAPLDVFNRAVTLNGEPYVTVGDDGDNQTCGNTDSTSYCAEYVEPIS
jgi:hypothetical protein